MLDLRPGWLGEVSSLREVAGGRYRSPDLAARWRWLACSPIGYPNPSPPPHSQRPPARGRRESGAAAQAAPARTWAGRWGEEGKKPGPPCPLAPGRERREQDIPCPRTREGKGRAEEELPLLGGAPPAAPRGRRANQATPPLFSPGPHDSALEQGGGGLGWLRPYRPSPPFFKLPPCFPPPTLSLLPPLHDLLPGKRNRNEGGGLKREEKSTPPPPGHSQNPGDMEVGQDFGPKPQPPRNPHSRSGTPKITNRLLLLFPRSSWG